MSPKERPKDPLNLEQLGETYEVIGELSGRRDARSFIAKRREDGGDVLITVAETPDGDEGNALSHLAADTNLLSGHTHRNLLPILEGRWLGTDAFALVTERIYAPALEELLSRRDEAFDYPRIATILQDVNAVLEWARGLKVVHRAVGLDTLFLEHGSDRVLVSFAMRPLPLADMPGPEDDAKTVATLARAMLTRSAAAPERAHLPLAELRPGLPTKLIEQTDLLLQLSRGSTVPDMTGYIAVIAMAEALKRSETEGAEATLKMLDEERLAREKIEAERLATERAAAEQARLFQKEREEFAKEKDRIERALAKEREALAKERTALAKEREEHARNRAALITEREEHKLWAEQVQEQLTVRGSALESQAELYAHTTEFATPVGDDTAFVVPPPPKRKRVRPAWWTRAWQQRPHWNTKWNVPAAVSGLVLAIAVSGLAISRNRTPARARGVEVARTPVERTPVARIVDSMAGAVAIPAAASFGSALDVPADLVAGVVARAAAAPPPTPRGEGPVPSEPVASFVDTSFSGTPAAQTAPRPDTIFTPAAPAKTDSVAKPKADSVPKRDSLPRDTLSRRDTLQVLPRAAP